MNDTQEIERYRAALKNHDWYYNFSDDYRAWNRGKDSMESISAMRRQLDPNYEIWNEFAPEEMKAKVAK